MVEILLRLFLLIKYYEIQQIIFGCLFIFITSKYIKHNWLYTITLPYMIVDTDAFYHLLHS